MSAQEASTNTHQQRKNISIKDQRVSKTKGFGKVVSLSLFGLLLLLLSVCVHCLCGSCLSRLLPLQPPPSVHNAVSTSH